MDQPDIIVIGAGAAGVACAARLAKAGRRVLLIEAGKTDKVMKSRIPALMAGMAQISKALMKAKKRYRCMSSPRLLRMGCQ